MRKLGPLSKLTNAAGFDSSCAGRLASENIEPSLFEWFGFSFLSVDEEEIFSWWWSSVELDHDVVIVSNIKKATSFRNWSIEYKPPPKELIIIGFEDWSWGTCLILEKWNKYLNQNTQNDDLQRWTVHYYLNIFHM